MNKIKKFIPYIAAVLLFVLIAYAYAPSVLENKVVNQSDISAWQGMARSTLDHNAENPDDPALWSDSMFGGMPTYSIVYEPEGDWTKPLYKALFWGKRPPSYLIISLLGAFLLFLAFGVNPYLAILGAIAVSFCSYNMQIIQVGHNTKMVAIAFMPWVLAALVYGYRRNALVAAPLLALAVSFQVKANHPQITYYLAFIILAIVIAEFVAALRRKAFATFMKKSSLLLLGGLFGLLVNANNLVPLYDYSKYTMRGGSELATSDSEVKGSDGLKIDYATAWSYGIEETPNLLIPNFNGGSSVPFDKNSQTQKTLRKYQGAEQLSASLTEYWGPQPFTAGPMYVGAVSIFLALLGLFVSRGRYKWAFFGVGLLALLLGWGSNLMFFTEFFYKHVPLYSKFRTVSMSLTVLQIVVPALAVLGLNEILFKNTEAKRLKNSLIAALAISGGFCLLCILFPSLAGTFVSDVEADLPGDIFAALSSDREALMVSDAWRSLIFILFAASAVLLFSKNILKKAWMVVAALSLLILVDLWGVDKRYLNESHFMPQRKFLSQYNLRPADQAILEDSDLGYRVLDLEESSFNSAYASYYHRSIGGYSPAKLSIYQDLIEQRIHPEMNRLIDDVNGAIKAGAKTYAEVEDALGYYPMLSMLGLRYIILDGGGFPLFYRYGANPAYFVDDVLTASSAREQMTLLGEIDPLRKAVVAEEVSAFSAPTDGDVIDLVQSTPNSKVYAYTTLNDAFAVFSEIWYPSGWKAWIDGEPASIVRTNYSLRGLWLPAGEHVVEFRFEPETVALGRSLSLCGSVAILLLLIAVVAGKKYLCIPKQ